MKILMVSSEVYPFAKTGGLADVTGSLPIYLDKMGYNLSIIMPYYRTVREGGFDCELMFADVPVPISSRIELCNLYKTSLNDNISVYFIDKKQYYERPYLYGPRGSAYIDNAERFTFFSRAVLEVMLRLNLRPAIIHCNDWHTGLIPVYIKTIYSNMPFFTDLKTIFTIHNLAYQGIFWKHDMHLTNIGWEVFNHEGIEYYDDINFLKGGLNFADIITTVSKTYSEEIQTPRFGEGLDGVLRKRAKDLFGITNGIDCKEWDPETDPNIAKNYSIKDMAGKRECKRDLMRSFGINKNMNIPLVGVISRLVEQKGIDILCESIEDILKIGANMVVLGIGDEKYHSKLSYIQKRHPHNIKVIFRFDNSLAHKIEAGADIFLMPSRFEPCGLNQMYSLRYGTIPVVSAVGGLNDTVKNFSLKTGKGNGFKFKNYTKRGMICAVSRAVSLYKNKKAWRRIIKNAMEDDNSWERSAKQYDRLYKKTMRARVDP